MNKNWNPKRKILERAHILYENTQMYIGMRVLKWLLCLPTQRDEIYNQSKKCLLLYNNAWPLYSKRIHTRNLREKPSTSICILINGRRHTLWRNQIEFAENTINIEYVWISNKKTNIIHILTTTKIAYDQIYDCETSISQFNRPRCSSDNNPDTRTVRPDEASNSLI